LNKQWHCVIELWVAFIGSIMLPWHKTIYWIYISIGHSSRLQFFR
jgi:hypothetical protein